MAEVASRHLGLVTKAQHRKSKVQEEEADEYLLMEEKGVPDKAEEKKEEEADDLVRWRSYLTLPG